MTDKQLLKRLQYQQNRLLDVKGYSFYVSSSNEDIGMHFNVWIHDCNKCYKIVFTDCFDIKDSSLTIKLIKLRDFVDGLLNN